MKEDHKDPRTGEMEAVARLKTGDIGGLESLVRHHQVRALRVSHLIVGDPILAQDVVQDAFLRAFDRIGSFDPERRFAPWFMRMVVNGSIDAASRGRRRAVSEGVLGQPSAPGTPEPVDPEPGPDHVAEENDRRSGILDALEELPPRYRAAIVQRYYLGMSEAEMARQDSVPVGTVKWRLHTARKRLSRFLGPSASAAVPDTPDLPLNAEEGYGKA